ncbi:MAG TPA: FAD-binding oxidoreductase [Acidimicrobiia bacterium]|jgi:glycine/D-amino acid oxidase-like deaminating enzyme
MRRSAEVLVIGAGIAGVAAAYELAVEQGVGRVVLVDSRPPLTLTSDKSTECYRNWWPSKPMVQLMNRSIDLLEHMATVSGNAFGLNRRGYLFVTGEKERFQRMFEDAHHISTLGAGPVRLHPGPIPYRNSPSEGFHGSPEGADILVGPDTVRSHFPFITERAVGAIHVRRAGWFSAQQLGAWMLSRAREAGLELVADEVVGIDVAGESVKAGILASGGRIEAPAIVNAGGPLAGKIGAMVGVELPLFSELHHKVAFREHQRIVPRDAPMFIWSDPQTIPWSEEERRELAGLGRMDLLDEMPIYCHGRPEGGADSPYLLALWEYHGKVEEPVWPVPEDELFPEVVMRGLVTMVPGLSVYLDRLPASSVDGGYYTKTRENRPLIGPIGPTGFHVAVGYSGFGVMVAAGAGDLVARHVIGAPLPEHAAAFLPSRYDEPGYLGSVASGSSSGQL